MSSVAIALITYPYWLIMAADTALDLNIYLSPAGYALKIILPLAVVGNVAGIVIAAAGILRRSDRRNTYIVGLVMNALPIAGIMALLLWLTFGFKM
jgi:hypothetical protein